MQSYFVYELTIKCMIQRIFDCKQFLYPDTFFSEGGSQEGEEADLAAHVVSKHLVTNKVLKYNYNSYIFKLIFQFLFEIGVGELDLVLCCYKCNMCTVKLTGKTSMNCNITNETACLHYHHVIMNQTRRWVSVNLVISSCQVKITKVAFAKLENGILALACKFGIEIVVHFQCCYHEFRVWPFFF